MKITQNKPTNTIKGAMPQKRINGKQPLLYTTHRLDLIYIPIKSKEDIPNGYGTRKMFWGK